MYVSSVNVEVISKLVLAKNERDFHGFLIQQHSSSTQIAF